MPPQKPGYLEMPPMGVNVQQLNMPPLVVQPPLGAKSVWADDEWTQQQQQGFTNAIEQGLAPVYHGPNEPGPGDFPFEYIQPPVTGPTPGELARMNPGPRAMSRAPSYNDDVRAAAFERMREQADKREQERKKRDKGGGFLDTLLGVASFIPGPVGDIAGGIKALTGSGTSGDVQKVVGAVGDLADKQRRKQNLAEATAGVIGGPMAGMLERM